MTGPPLSCENHVGRARYHERVGDALRTSAGDSWAAVCYFYSAFHLARAAISTDPIWDDFGSMKAVHQDLLPRDQGTTAHNVRRNGDRRFGLNDLVRILYPPIGIAYLHLHGASVGVRYEKGILTTLDDLRQDLDEISDYFKSNDQTERLEELRGFLLQDAES